jgi:Skp family chaperone for outer membrane proteins
MKTLMISAAFAASMIAPAAAQAQAIPAAVVAVVDLDKVTSSCTSCKTAAAALKGQLTTLQTRQVSLAGPLETEQKSIQTAIDALKGAEPDAALQARIRAFQTKRQSAADEITRQEQQIQRNQQYIQQQVATKLGPIYQQVMQRRGANVLVEMGATLATSSSIDVTNDVLAALNTALPTIQTVAPAQPQQKQPQGR